MCVNAEQISQKCPETLPDGERLIRVISTEELSILGVWRF